MNHTLNGLLARHGVAAHATLTVGHRGARSVAPANTVPPFERAIRDGAHAVEFDIRLSADGVPVCCHDETVDRCSDAGGKIGDYTVAQLETVDAGAWFGAEFKDTRLPTLADALNLMQKRVLPVIEIKTEPDDDPGADVRAAVVQVLATLDLVRDVVVSSYSTALIAGIKEAVPDIAVALIEPAPAKPPPAWLDGWHPRARDLDEDLVSAAHALGLWVIPWTVNDPADAKGWIDAGVEGIITDTPAMMA